MFVNARICLNSPGQRPRACQNPSNLPFVNLSSLPGEVYLPLPLPRDPGAPKVELSIITVGPFGHFFSTLFPSTFSTHFWEPKSTPRGLKNDPREASTSTFWCPNGSLSFPSFFVRFSLRCGTQLEALGGKLVASFLSLLFSTRALLQHRACHETL